MLKGNLLYGQSGGPSAVINASAYGVITEAMKRNDVIEDVIVMRHGIEGALEEDFLRVSDFIDQIDLLPKTPGSAFGSCRYKLSSYKEDDTDMKRLVNIFKKYNVRYFAYNGGNDSMDTCVKVEEYCTHIGYDMKVIGIPKTVDNDLPHIDHTPGFGSAAKYIINTLMQIRLDADAYKKGKVTIVEIMGRHAGWLTASTGVAQKEGLGPDLIYLPETPFSMDSFLRDVEAVYSKRQKCLIAISEGIKDKDGNFIGISHQKTDAFGHNQLGGVAVLLGSIIEEKLLIKYRAVELSTVQRSASFMRSKTDVLEAIEVGRYGVNAMINGESGKMVVMNRVSNNPYKIEYSTYDVSKIANHEQAIPNHMIDSENHQMTEAFYEYIYPLIDGGYKQQYSKGTQDFFKI